MTAIPIRLSVAPPPVEWPDESWRAELERTGAWRPRPFQQFVLKIHGRCNLACDYCYVYEMADQSWRDRPAVMDRAILARAARRIGEHAETHGLTAVQVIYHGGEPLLVGADYLDYASQTLREAMPAGTKLDLTAQTNGVLLDERMLTVLDRYDIGLGVSLDGDRAANDRHRRYANGRSSYDLVVQGLERLSDPAYRRLFRILLCTIDLANDPVATYESLLRFAPPAVDFLLPHGNWDELPPGRNTDPDSTPYGDWLIAVFDRWYGAPQQETSVRLLQNIIDEILIGRSSDDQIGLAPSALIEVETDGSLQQVCTLKSAYDGATCTGLTVANSFDQALRLPAVAARQVGAAALADRCGSCAIRDICGGGYYPHRYRSGVGFRNPTVYCPDMLRLIPHIQQRLQADITQLLQGGVR